MSAPPKKRLGEMLIEAGVIDEPRLRAALGHQRRWGGKLGQSLVDMKFTTEGQIVEALARRFGYEVVNLRDLRTGPGLEAALKLVPRELASRHTVLPFAVDVSSLSVAMSDPSNIAAVDELSFLTGKRIKVAIAGDREVYEAIRRFYYAEEESQRAVEPIPLELDPEPAPMETIADPFGSLQSFFDEAARQRPGVPDTGAIPWTPRAGAGLSVPLQLDDEEEILDATDLAPAPPAPDREPPPAAAAPAEPAPAAAARPLAPGEQLLLDAVLKLARGEPVDPAVLSPERLAAALLRLLLEKQVLTPAEVASALARR